MQPIPETRKFSLKCARCGTTGAPVRVESQTPVAIALSLRCDTCRHEWRAEGDLPTFLAWVKPDRRKAAVKLRPLERGAVSD